MTPDTHLCLWSHPRTNGSGSRWVWRIVFHNFGKKASGARGTESESGENTLTSALPVYVCPLICIALGAEQTFA